MKGRIINNRNKPFMTRNNVWVTPKGNDWKVKSSGSQRAAGIFDTKAEAVKRAREIAENKQAELIVKNKDNEIAWRNSYGNDPYPPKG